MTGSIFPLGGGGTGDGGGTGAGAGGTGPGAADVGTKVIDPSAASYRVYVVIFDLYTKLVMTTISKTALTGHLMRVELTHQLKQHTELTK
jgi:hypothetical protein